MSEIKVELLYPGQSLEDFREQIWAILQSADSDFVPSLSTRKSTTEKSLNNASAWTGPVDYFKFVMSQHTFLAVVDGRIAGLSSFIVNYVDDALAPMNPSTYVTTTIVKLAYRRQGVGHALNDAIENLDRSLASPFITRRTWSTNVANVTLLTERGFQELLRIPNDRGDGIDTIYFGKPT